MRREIIIAVIATVVGSLVVEAINWTVAEAKARYWERYSNSIAAAVDTLRGQQDYWQSLAKYRGAEAAKLTQKLKALNAPLPAETK